MSCFGTTYNPTITRTWSRIKPVCMQEPDYVLNEQRKGDVLQYKKNSLNITKQQRYAKIARGKWINRNTTWASQSETSTNPNTKSLMRVNYTGTPYCPPIIDPIIPPILPDNNNNNNNNNNPSVLPTPSDGGGGGGGVLPPIPTPTPEPIIPVLPDGGQLVCNMVQEICTGEIVDIYPSQTCYPTTFSDVPGPIIELCYSENIPV